MVGVVVQIIPGAEGVREHFHGCFAVIEEVSESGRVLAYVPSCDTEREAVAYLYLPMGTFVEIGHAAYQWDFQEKEMT